MEGDKRLHMVLEAQDQTNIKRIKEAIKPEPSTSAIMRYALADMADKVNPPKKEGASA